MDADVDRTADEPALGEAIPGLDAWLAGQSRAAHEALRALACLLNNVPPPPKDGDARHAFVVSCLGEEWPQLVEETRELSGSGPVMVGLALAELLADHHPTLGPTNFQASSGTEWAVVTVGPDAYHVVKQMTAYFAGTAVAGVDLVVTLHARGTLFSSRVGLSVTARAGDHDHASRLLETIMRRADELNVFRGRVLKAVAGQASRDLNIEVLDFSPVSREEVIAADQIWSEIDLSIRAVSTHSAEMARLQLGVRRGVLLVGPPGVGKTSIAAVVASEMVGEFTVVYCDGDTGAALLGQVFEECVRLGPSVIIIEDVDLIVGRRGQSRGYALAEFLAALDSHPSAQLLVLATTNDVATLDAAAVRAARMDSIVEVPYPSPVVARAILAALLHRVPGCTEIDLDTVVAGLPPQTTGADLREIVRRSVLTAEAGQPISTSMLRDQIGSGRYRPVMPGQGAYI